MIISNLFINIVVVNSRMSSFVALLDLEGLLLALRLFPYFLICLLPASPLTISVDWLTAMVAADC